MVGADISNHKKGITMAELQALGVQFLIIKATQGARFCDPCGPGFYIAAREAEIPMGVYCYSEATTPEAAAVEAQYLLDRIRGWPMPCGVWMDVETTEQLRLPDAQLTETIRAWCAVIRAAGYVPGVYSSEYSGWSKIDSAALREDVLIWVAHYGKMPVMACDLWQYTDQQTVYGHEFKVDVDITRSERFKKMVEAGKVAMMQPATAPAEETTSDISGALDLLGRYLKTPEFAKGFLKFVKGDTQ